jgi:hypothetical protein
MVERKEKNDHVINRSGTMLLLIFISISINIIYIFFIQIFFIKEKIDHVTNSSMQLLFFSTVPSSVPSLLARTSTTNVLYFFEPDQPESPRKQDPTTFEFTTRAGSGLKIGLGLYTVGSGFCGLVGLCSKSILVLGVRHAGLAQNPGLHGLGLFVM